jgi:hypothetical protein
MNEHKRIEGYLHYYLGCECVNSFFPPDHKEYSNRWKLMSIDLGNPTQPYRLENEENFTYTGEIKLILRPLSTNL